ncbi:Hsp20/alpha crystallin family protein [Stagnimonas aquatica]|uniref:Hsp20/alpha crystallin family protein n=1 Tax=Stagnimonas aquatica TaxID=2689987 RepID=A0A3N0VES6_9GAMM|nr:Hsp20/alpha crystallin family protein [Stagnimonas aquatica]ROH91182.1 Hsp20/alpha crystallin family protein [Stagnimonas aquatica]
MSLTRYEPWSLHRALLNEFTRALDANSQDASTGATADWTPSVDIAEYADKFVLSADIPGVDPASVEVTLENGVLTLSGSREKAVEAAGVERRRIERATGRFFRRFALPDTIDGESVSASGKHGVLEIVIPKRPASQPRRINVTH